MDRQRTRAILGFLLTTLVIVSIGLVSSGVRRDACELQVRHVLECDLFTVNGLVGSEKLSFFQDEDVIEEFALRGLTVTVRSAGSRTMACDGDLSGYDFAFPGSASAAADVLANAQVTGEPVVIFSSPLVVATFEDVAAALPPGVASADARTFDVARYLTDVFRAGKRWGDLTLDGPYPAFQRAILLSTRLDTSNSAELFLALASAADSGSPAVPAPNVSAQTEWLTELFRAQGSTGLTSDEPFDQYLSAEGYQLPMQVVYEAQFLDALRTGSGDLVTTVTGPDGTSYESRRLMLYPTPSISSDHAIAPLTDRGRMIAEALTEDEDLRRLAAEHGFRPAGDPAAFASVNEELGFALPEVPGPAVSLRPNGEWTGFMNGVIDGVYGEDRAGAACT